MANQNQGRKAYLERNRTARGWAALNHALNQQLQVTPDPSVLKKNSLNGKSAVIVGSGVAGLTTAYELLSRNSGLNVIVLEANDRTGGRCLTLRTGDTLTEDKGSQLQSLPGETQVVRFERPVGDSEPYLNAGPGRIPSSHKRLLNYLRQFGVEVEIYVMASGSNLSQMKDGPTGGAPVVNRRLTNNTRGWIAQMVYQNAESLLDSADYCSLPGDDEGAKAAKAEMAALLRCLMVSFGDLAPDGKYEVGTSPPGEDDNIDASDRAGYTELPGVKTGKIAEAIRLDELLKSEFWRKTRIYQPDDFLWQQTSFQPVGGMDRVQHAFARQVANLGGTIHLNSPVTSIGWDESRKKFRIKAKGHEGEFLADYCFSNVAIPFLETILSDELQGGADKGFEEKFTDALKAVYVAQAAVVETERFLACTTKVGWQAARCLWQGKHITPRKNKDGLEVLAVADSEVGVVPVYGGISWTDDPIMQIWYPSEAYHDVKGVLTGCYNFGQAASDAGKESVQTRLDNARDGARLFGQEFGNGMQHGVAIAWQNMPHIKGGWAQWKYVDKGVDHYNVLIQGAGVNGDDKPCFFIVGDQVSCLPGWQEGAIASALNAISRLANPDWMLPHMASLPDPQLMVEGI